MSWIETLAGQEVSLICFAEYSCFIHFDPENHLRVESSAQVKIDNNIISLFPEVQFETINSLLGKSFQTATISQNILTLVLSNDTVIIIELKTGYESIHIVTDLETVVL